VVVKHGGKQYWAQSGSKLTLEKIKAEVGELIQLEVIASGEGAKFDAVKKTIDAKIVKHYKDDKVLIFKKKRRHHYERKKGHRQCVTQVQIDSI